MNCFHFHNSHQYVRWDGELGDYLSKPNSVYVRDLNADKRPDLVVRTRGNNNFFYLQQEDGSYQSLAKILDKEQEILDKEQEQIRSTIESKVKNLK